MKQTDIIFTVIKRSTLHNEVANILQKDLKDFLNFVDVQIYFGKLDYFEQYNKICITIKRSSLHKDCPNLLLKGL